MLKIRRSHDRLIFNMGIFIPMKDGLYIETGPRPSNAFDINYFKLGYSCLPGDGESRQPLLNIEAWYNTHIHMHVPSKVQYANSIPNNIYLNIYRHALLELFKRTFRCSCPGATDASCITNQSTNQPINIYISILRHVDIDYRYMSHIFFIFGTMIIISHLPGAPTNTD